MGPYGGTGISWHCKRRVQPFKGPCESSGSSRSGSKKKLIGVIGDDAKDALKIALGNGEHNSLFAGVRAAGGWDLGRQDTHVEAFAQANASLNENLNLFAETAVSMEEWHGTVGLKWSW
tara:strand:+ start:398 stop:754 length:357 start_codon:yes stop_codon:yes gene_type:complete